MKKYLFLLAVVALLAAPGLVIGSVPDQQTLSLYEKDPVTWDIVPDGASGEIIFGSARPTFCFSLCANGLEGNQDYTLIYYPDPWPGDGLICLGTSTTDEHGRLRLQVQYTDALNIGDMPRECDDNYPTGAKIWLVLSADVDCVNQTMIGWNPTEYLFENNLITYEDTEDTVDLFEKDAAWDIVSPGAEGTLQFDPFGTTFDFCFQGSGLVPLQEYTLIYYPDPWPGTGLICLGSRRAFKNGNTTIRGSVDTGDLDDAKIWLVLSEDVDCGIPEMVGWNPEEYLFENNLIQFHDLDD